MEIRAAFEAGAKLFDAGAFWDAHEAWEEPWRSATEGTTRLLLQGLIQIAAAFHHLVERSAPEQATSCFTKGLRKLDALPKDFEIDLDAFRVAIQECARAVVEGHFEPSLIPKLRSES